MLKSVVFFAIGAVALISGPAYAAEECDSYTVAKGDTLRIIAERYYGARNLSPVIYHANTDIIGGNPNAIEIGMSLSIPCRDGITMPLASAFMATIEPAQSTADESAKPVFLAKDGGTPFVDENGGGIIPEILGAALRSAGYRDDFLIERPSSRSEILDISSHGGNALLSFPWIMPECGDPFSLSEQSQIICANYTFSDPVFEITLGLFVRPDDPLANATLASDFLDKNFCIPEFHSIDLLMQNRIALGKGTISRAPSYNSCLQGLDDGRFDVIIADYNSSDKFAPEASNRVVDVAEFAHPTTLHAIALSQNAEAMRVLEMVNTGLKQIKESGEWFDIAVSHLGQ